jgi:putative tryptophan/tyrosine transport system substrate-binding protein
MQRREFIKFIGGAAAAWPLVARAQQPAMPLVGYLHSASPEPYAPMMAAFRQGLKETSYVEGQNVALEFRWAEGRPERLPALAAELVRRQVAVLATGGGDPPALAARQASTTIPIVFVTSDPVRSGLVASLNRPGANITGVSLFTWELGPKRLEILRELVPTATIAVLVNPFVPNLGQQEVPDAARSIGQQVEVLYARNEQEIDAAFTAIGQTKAEALLVVSSPLFTNRRHQIVALANHYRVPTIYPLREYAVSGGLMSYGTSIADAYHQSGVYAGRMLKGERPADLPVMQPTRFELVINLKTAKALGLEIPPMLLARADEVIE